MDSIVNTHILDLSQRTTINSNYSDIIIDNWTNNSPCNYTDRIDDDDIKKIKMEKTFDIEQSLTDQFQNLPLKEDSMSDSSNINKSKLDLYNANKKIQ